MRLFSLLVSLGRRHLRRSRSRSRSRTNTSRQFISTVVRLRVQNPTSFNRTEFPSHHGKYGVVLMKMVWTQHCEYSTYHYILATPSSCMDAASSVSTCLRWCAHHSQSLADLPTHLTSIDSVVDRFCHATNQQPSTVVCPDAVRPGVNDDRITLIKRMTSVCWSLKRLIPLV